MGPKALLWNYHVSLRDSPEELSSQIQINQSTFQDKKKQTISKTVFHTTKSLHVYVQVDYIWFTLYKRQ